MIVKYTALAIVVGTLLVLGVAVQDGRPVEGRNLLGRRAKESVLRRLHRQRQGAKLEAVIAG